MKEVDPTRAQLKGQIEDLRAQGDTDRSLISDLEAQAVLDHALIEQLQDTGEIDRFEVKGLQVALATCKRIGVAIGFVMATRQVSQAEALRILCQASEDTGRNLRDTADYVTLTGELPTSTATSPTPL